MKDLRRRLSKMTKDKNHVIVNPENLIRLYTRQGINSNRFMAWGIICLECNAVIPDDDSVLEDIVEDGIEVEK